MDPTTMYMIAQLGSAYLSGQFQQPSFQPRNSFMGGGPDVDPMTKLAEANQNIRNLFNTGADTLNRGISLPDANIPQTPSWSGGGMPMAFGTLGGGGGLSGLSGGGEGGLGGGSSSGPGSPAASLPHSSGASAVQALNQLLKYSAGGSNGSGGGYGSGSSGGAGMGYGQGFNNAGIDLNAHSNGPGQRLKGPMGINVDVNPGRFDNPEARAAGFFSGNPFGGFYGGDVAGGGGEQFTDASMTGRKAKAY